MSCTTMYPTGGGIYGNRGVYNSGGVYNGGGAVYGNNDVYFPDDYYYEYPNDYYRDDYYQGFYNDYRNSISSVNWNNLFLELNLSRMQINAILDLNNQFNSFGIWNNYYRMNPNRWYYDRFYALERIMGARAFGLFQNRYYRGMSPINFYVNNWRTNYQPRYNTYYVLPQYRNVDINRYRVDRNVVHSNAGGEFGYNRPRNTYNPGGFREGNNSNPLNTGRVGNMDNTNVQSTQRMSGGLRNDVRVQPNSSSVNVHNNGRFGGGRQVAPSNVNTPTRIENRSGNTGIFNNRNTNNSSSRISSSSRMQSAPSNRVMQSSPSSRMQSAPTSTEIRSSSSTGSTSSGSRTGGGRF